VNQKERVRVAATRVEIARVDTVNVDVTRLDRFAPNPVVHPLARLPADALVVTQCLEQQADPNSSP